MDSSVEAFSQVVTKYVLGSQDRFNELKKRLTMCEHAMSKAGAAALGYLIAMEEKEEEEKEEPTVYDDVVDVLYRVDEGHVGPCEAADKIFSIIYQWIDKILEEDGYDAACDGVVPPNTRTVILEAFANKMPPL